MAKTTGAYTQSWRGVKKGTSQGRNPDTSTMNKSKKRSFKKYRGQGR
tara:strand:+ start:188 stop:328 length:141 start_codon:yes stop_codon:yes gene_type:complete